MKGPYRIGLENMRSADTAEITPWYIVKRPGCTLEADRADGAEQVQMETQRACLFPPDNMGQNHEHQHWLP